MATLKSPNRRVGGARAGRRHLGSGPPRDGRSREVAAEAAEALHKARQHTQELNGAFASLTALQQEALGRTDQDMSQWLREQNLFDAPRLGEQVEVEDGWQHAVEVVLGARLEAVLCSDGQSLGDFAASLQRHAVTLSLTVVKRMRAPGGCPASQS